MYPTVVQRFGKYLTEEDRFEGDTVEQAAVFPDLTSADRHVRALDLMAGDDIRLEFHAAAVAREDQEYARQLEDLRG